MSNDDKATTILAGICLVVGAIFGFGFTREAVNGAWKADMVKRGFAEYSQTTGEWQWKDGAK